MAQSAQRGVAQVRVFVGGPGGGNPAPVVLDADAMGDAEMQTIAAEFGHEAGFVMKPTDPKKADLRYRFFVRRSEMDMCGACDPWHDLALSPKAGG